MKNVAVLSKLRTDIFMNFNKKLWRKKSLCDSSAIQYLNGQHPCHSCLPRVIHPFEKISFNLLLVDPSRLFMDQKCFQTASSFPVAVFLVMCNFFPSSIFHTKNLLQGQNTSLFLESGCVFRYKLCRAHLFLIVLHQRELLTLSQY